MSNKMVNVTFDSNSNIRILPQEKYELTESLVQEESKFIERN